MTSILSHLLNGKCVYWPPGSLDGYGNRSLGTPEQRDCHWTETLKEIVDAEGRVYSTTVEVYLDSAVEREGLLFNGLLADIPASPLSNPSVQIIRDCRVVPDVDETETVYIANA